MDYIYLTDDFFLEDNSFFWVLLVISTVSILVTSISYLIEIFTGRMGAIQMRNIFIKKLDDTESQIQDLRKNQIYANERITKLENLAKELAIKNQKLQLNLDHISKTLSNGTPDF